MSQLIGRWREGIGSVRCRSSLAGPLVLAVLLAPAGRLSAEDLSPMIDASMNPLQVQNLGDTPGHKNHAMHIRDAMLLCDKANYAIRYCACVDPAHQGKAVPMEGYIGMPQPSAANWYHSGFLFILLNGRDIGTTPLSSMVIAQRDRRAVLDMVWHDELASVRVRFLLLPHHDHLDCEIAIEPKNQIKSVEVRLNCYPSFFTAAYHRDGARRIRAPTTLVEQGQRVTLPAKENWWGVYYDEVFDVAKGEGDGPCGLVLLPDQATQIALEPGSYGVGTRIGYRPETRRIRLAFWDFTRKTNADSLARVRSGAGAVRKELAALDFTPDAVKGVDVAAMRAEIRRAIASEGVRKSLGPKVAAVQAWLEKYGPALEKKRPAEGIEAEERLLESIDAYRDFSWEVKLAELLEKL
jgi:hypothetical protein